MLYTSIVITIGIVFLIRIAIRNHFCNMRMRDVFDMEALLDEAYGFNKNSSSQHLNLFISKAEMCLVFIREPFDYAAYYTELKKIVLEAIQSNDIKLTADIVYNADDDVSVMSERLVAIICRYFSRYVPKWLNYVFVFVVTMPLYGRLTVRENASVLARRACELDRAICDGIIMER